VPGAELTRKGSVAEGRYALGLTETNIKSDVEVHATGITNPLSHRYCLRPNIEVTLAFSPMTVYVGHEYPEGSCRFLMTMQHELEHVAIYREFLVTTAPEVERTLREYYGNRILYFASQEEGARKIADDTRDRLGPLVDARMGSVAEAQAKLDTREEYDRLQRACGGIALPSPGTIRPVIGDQLPP
jgi:hypothetical protein